MNTATPTAPVRLGCWTILAEGDDSVLATVTQERDIFTVRNARGKLLGRFPTAQQALASIAA
jgi:hypothetical protein